MDPGGLDRAAAELAHYRCSCLSSQSGRPDRTLVSRTNGQRAQSRPGRSASARTCTCRACRPLTRALNEPERGKGSAARPAALNGGRRYRFNGGNDLRGKGSPCRPQVQRRESLQPSTWPRFPLWLVRCDRRVNKQAGGASPPATTFQPVGGP